MTDITPETNLNKITALEGNMKTLQATMEGELKLQASHVQQIKKSSEDIGRSVTTLGTNMQSSVDTLTKHCADSVANAAVNTRDVAAIKQKIKGHEDVCAERDKRIQSSITQGFEGLTNVKAAEDKAEDKSDSNKVLRYGMYLSIIMGVLGWLIALV